MPERAGQPVEEPVIPTPLSSTLSSAPAPPTSASSGPAVPALSSEVTAPVPGGGPGGGGGGGGGMPASSFVSQADLDLFILRIMTVDLHSVAS